MRRCRALMVITLTRFYHLPVMLQWWSVGAVSGFGPLMLEFPGLPLISASACIHATKDLYLPSNDCF